MFPILFFDNSTKFGWGSLFCGIACGLMYAISKTIMLKGYERTSVAFITLCHSSGMIIPCVMGHFIWSEKLSIAAMCGITKYHLAREFKRITGQTVLTYLNALRCKKAQLLLSEGKTVTEAAFESGFESLSYFSRTYKRIMGAPPSRNHGK